MTHVRNFTFNTFMENTWVIYDGTSECIIVDPGCFEESEQQELKEFITSKGLKPVRLINTHCHIDHILGNDFIAETYGLQPEYHENGIPLLLDAGEIAASFGYRLNAQPKPKGYLTDNETVSFGNTTLKVLYTPGHAEGSICLYCQEGGFVITGDVLFMETIGRTDLPTGNFDLLMKSIQEKLFTLPDETIVYPGHGPETSIGHEKMDNPFIR